MKNRDKIILGKILKYIGELHEFIKGFDNKNLVKIEKL